MLYEKQEKPVSTKHEKLGEISFPVEVPQAQSLAEATTLCGSEDALLAFFNGQLSTNAKNAARAYARNYEVADGTPTDQYPTLVQSVITKGTALAHDYSPASDTERGPSKSKKAAAFDGIAALVNSGQDFTKEQLMALLTQVK